MIFKSAYNWLARMASKKVILLFFFLSHFVLLMMMLFTFPKINAKLGTKAFDLKTFGYSKSEALLMLKNLDEATIELYLFPQLFFLDILYPILLALFLSTVIIRLSHLIKIGKHNILSNLFILPFLAMLMDYFENSMISLMITNTDDVSSGVIQAASIFTLTKGLLTTICWCVILILTVIWLFNKFRDKKHIVQ